MSYYIGIDLGGTFIKFGAVDGSGSILKKDKIPTPLGCDYGATVSAIAKAVKGMIADMGMPESVGIGCPGVIDGEHGMVVTGGNLGWENKPLAQDLGERLGLPVALCNDANAAAYGEYACGAGKAYKSIVLITLGTGVGSGVIFGGKLFTGELGAGAELGHEVIRMDGEACACGRRGCFEAYASASALVRQTRNAMTCHPESRMWELCKGSADNADGRTAFDGMRRGDKTAKAVVERYLNYLAEGIANIANVFRPQTVLIGGGISAEGEALTLPLQEMVDTKILGRGRYAPVTIKAASLGNDAGLVGVAMLAKEIK
ncbi:MAG TPA: ROK family protein [Firmicutes bacterium]|nr:ROK family protein [Bacillota bacterium]